MIILNLNRNFIKILSTIGNLTFHKSNQKISFFHSFKSFQFTFMLTWFVNDQIYKSSCIDRIFMKLWFVLIIIIKASTWIEFSFNKIVKINPKTIFQDDSKLSSFDPSLDHHSSNSSLTSGAGVLLNGQREVRISPANTDLLFKLFDHIEQQQQLKGDGKQSSNKQQQFQQLQTQYRLLRNTQQQQQQKSTSTSTTTTKITSALLSKAFIKAEDPCILDAVSEGLFPQLKLLDSRTTSSGNVVDVMMVKNHSHSSSSSSAAASSSSSASDLLNSNGLSNSSPILSNTSAAAASNSILINSMINSSSSALPLIQYEQNYSQALSEVVATL